MLYAELRGKLSPGAQDLERSEDVLTSTVFGTLLIGAAPELLVDWFNSARLLEPMGRLMRDGPSLGLRPDPVSCWFWPRLSEAEPDVLLRIGFHLLVVEAKYGSGKSDTKLPTSAGAEPPDPVPASDQLMREWRSVQPNARGLEWYPPEISSAIASCQRHLVYLVSARGERTALRELIESQEKIRRATGDKVPMWLLTWQDLHAVLVRRQKMEPRAPVWVADFTRLLDRRHLAAFLGFPEILARTAPLQPIGQWASSWRGRDSFAAMAAEFEKIGFENVHRAAAAAHAWAARPERVRDPYFAAISRLDADLIRRVALYASKRFYAPGGRISLKRTTQAGDGG